MPIKIWRMQLGAKDVLLLKAFGPVSNRRATQHLGYLSNKAGPLLRAFIEGRWSYASIFQHSAGRR